MTLYCIQKIQFCTHTLRRSITTFRYFNCDLAFKDIVILICQKLIQVCSKELQFISYSFH